MQLMHPNGTRNISFTKTNQNSVPKLPTKEEIKKVMVRRRVEELAMLKEREELCYSL